MQRGTACTTSTWTPWDHRRRARAPARLATGRRVGNWPIFLTDSAVTPTGLDAARFTVFTRADNKRQSAFDGHPLYYFVDDKVPGDVKGLTFPPGLGHWFNIDPAQQ